MVQEDRVAPEEALHVLGTCLTEDDKDELVSIRHQLSEGIDWKDLVGSTRAELLVLIDGVINDGHCATGIPFEDLQETEQDFLSGDHENGDIRKRFVMLLLIRKLLSALKQDVKRDLDSIVKDAIEYELEVELKAIADGEEPELTAVVTMKPADGNCKHVVQTVRKILADGKKQKLDMLQSLCRDCGEPVGKPRVCGNSLNKGTKDSKNCRHEDAEWEEGSEGKVAICFDCGQPVPNPDKFKWRAVGLEVYGDNPELDELEIIIPRTVQVADA